MARDVFLAVKSRRDRIRLWRTHFMHQELKTLFHATGILKFVAMDILGPLTKTALEIVLFYS